MIGGTSEHMAPSEAEKSSESAQDELKVRAVRIIERAWLSFYMKKAYKWLRKSIKIAVRSCLNEEIGRVEYI